MGMDELRKECENLEIDVSNLLILGQGSSRLNGRYRQRVGQVKEQHLFAVQFCKDINLFVAWDLKRSKLRSIYSINGTKLVNISDKKIHHIRKNIEYSGWGEEDVLAFKGNAITSFLKQYILNV